MPGNKYNGSSNHTPSRLERLLRDREIRRNRASHSNEVTDNNRGSESFEHGLRLREDDRGVSYENGAVTYGEQSSQGSAASSLLSEGDERQDGRPSRQRLLVVANRLPVSAVRRGEDSWSLEISGGGLVTALLGKWWLDSYIECLVQFRISNSLQIYFAGSRVTVFS